MKNLLRIDHYSFGIANTCDEQDQIQRLLHQTFVLEIGQDADSGTGCLLDKFHHKNTYIVAVGGNQVCGVVALHDRPPSQRQVVWSARSTSNVLSRKSWRREGLPLRLRREPGSFLQE